MAQFNDDLFSDKMTYEELLLYLIVLHRKCGFNHKLDFLFSMIDSDKDEFISKLDLISFFKPKVSKESYARIESLFDNIFKVCNREPGEMIHIEEVRRAMNEELRLMVYKLVTINYD